MSEPDIPHFEIEVLPESLEQDFQIILQELRPQWNTEHVLFEKSEKEVSKGLLNTMVKCYNKNEGNQDAIMIRVHNTKMDKYFKRSIEVTCIKYFMKMDCAPKILATFKTGFCYEYIVGEILNSERIGTEPIWRLIAEQFAKFHSGNIEDEELLPKNKSLNEQFEEFWPGYPTDLPNPEKNKIFKRDMPTKEELKEELTMLFDHCIALKSPIVLCHNDTRGENIIWNAELGKVSFVDFELMNYNYQAAEIAAHFSRYCGLTPPDYSLLPSEEFQKKWLRLYLEKYNQYSGNKKEVSDKDIQRLYVQVRKFHAVNLATTALGCPMMEAMNVIDENKVDLLQIGITSIREYYKIKDEILQLKLPE